MESSWYISDVLELSGEAYKDGLVRVLHYLPYIYSFVSTKNNQHTTAIVAISNFWHRVTAVVFMNLYTSKYGRFTVYGMPIFPGSSKFPPCLMSEIMNWRVFRHQIHSNKTKRYVHSRVRSSCRIIV